MSLERIISLLEEFGFSRIEAEVYLYLAKTGARITQDVTKNLKISALQLNSILRRLEQKGAVTANSEHLKALEFEELLNQFVKLNLIQAQNIKASKKELLENWKNLATNQNNETKS